MHKALFILLVLIVFTGGFLIYENNETQVDCINILDTPKEPIIKAIELIKQYSFEDYGYLCRYGGGILFHKQEEDDAAGRFYYFKNKKTDEEDAYISLRKDFLEDAVYISSVLVHEACHAYRISEFSDNSEPPCDLAQAEHIKRLPNELIRTELVKKEGQINIYCSESSRNNNTIYGKCLFNNHSLEQIDTCTRVFIINNQQETEKQVCANIASQSYKQIDFTLSIPAEVYIPSYQNAVDYTDRKNDVIENSSIRKSNLLCRWLKLCG